MYAKFAKWYGTHYRSIKDHDAEVERIAYLLEKLDTQPRSILDIACGTGEHARILRDTYGFKVNGIGLKPNLVEIDGLAATIKSIARHLRTDGWLLIAP